MRCLVGASHVTRHQKYVGSISSQPPRPPIHLLDFTSVAVHCLFRSSLSRRRCRQCHYHRHLYTPLPSSLPVQFPFTAVDFACESSFLARPTPSRRRFFILVPLLRYPKLVPGSVETPSPSVRLSQPRTQETQAWANLLWTWTWTSAEDHRCWEGRRLESTERDPLPASMRSPT